MKALCKLSILGTTIRRRTYDNREVFSSSIRSYLGGLIGGENTMFDW